MAPAAKVNLMNMKKEKKAKPPSPVSSRRHVREVWYGCACILVSSVCAVYDESGRLVFIVGLVQQYCYYSTINASFVIASNDTYCYYCCCCY